MLRVGRGGGQGASGRGGFTLVEALIVMAILGLGAVLAVPGLQRAINRAKILGAARETAVFLQQARLEAIRQQVPAVVRYDPARREILVFADVHGATATDPPDGLFGPIAGLPNRTTDYLIANLVLPGTVELAGPVADSETDGLTLVGSDRVYLFQPDGSIADAGAFRFGDTRGNFLEVRVAPAATARVRLRKWDPDLAPGPDGTHWYAHGEGGVPWKWL